MDLFFPCYHIHFVFLGEWHCAIEPIFSHLSICKHVEFIYLYELIHILELITECARAGFLENLTFVFYL